MDKWLLLVFSCVTVYALVETVFWFFTKQNSSEEDIRKTMGYSKSSDPEENERKATFYKSSPHGLFFAVFVIFIIAFATVTATIKAFFR
jgi:hypothetical protein